MEYMDLSWTCWIWVFIRLFTTHKRLDKAIIDGYYSSNSDIFGVRHMGTIYNTFGLGCPIGSYIFSVRVIGYIYDMEAGGEDHSCLGTRCFMISFFIMASLALLGFLFAIALFQRTRGFYTVRRLKHSLK